MGKPLIYEPQLHFIDQFDWIAVTLLLLPKLIPSSATIDVLKHTDKIKHQVYLFFFFYNKTKKSCEFSQLVNFFPPVASVSVKDAQPQSHQQFG